MTDIFADLRSVQISVKKPYALTDTRATHYRHVTPTGPMHGP